MGHLKRGGKKERAVVARFLCNVSNGLMSKIQSEENKSFLILGDVNWLGSNFNTDLTTGNNMNCSSPINEGGKYFHTFVLASAGVALQNPLSYFPMCSALTD